MTADKGSDSVSWRKKNLKQNGEKPEFFEYVHW